MSQFDDALTEGFEAHRNATRARNEIQETIAELSAAVSRSTQQRVFVEAARVQKTTMLAGLASMMERTVEVISNQLPEPEIPDALFAVRRGAEHGKRAQLCRLKIGEHGFPVEITVAGQFMHAGDRDALTASLARLLRHPDVAGKIARVAELRGEEPPDGQPALGAGPSPSEKTAEQAKPWLEAESETDREQGYRIIGDAIQRQEEIAPDLRRYLRDVVLDHSRAYSERIRSVQLLTQADRFDDETRSMLATLWFNEPDIPTTFSSALSGIFDRRKYVSSLVAELHRVSVPRDDEPPSASDRASHGYRVSQAFGSIRTAVTIDKSTPLDAQLRADIRALCARYRGVTSLIPLLGEVESAIA